MRGHILINGEGFRKLVSGEEVEFAGGISIKLADIGFNVMRSYIDEAEYDKENAGRNPFEREGYPPRGSGR